MKPAQIIFACMSAFLITAHVSAAGVCEAVNGGCRDLETGVIYVYENGRLVHPETKQVYMDIPKPDASSEEQEVQIIRWTYTLRAPRNTREPDARPPINNQKMEARAPMNSHKRGANAPTNTGAINAVTGEFYAPAGQGYVGTRDGTYYAPAGPGGVIDTRTGQFIPMH